MGSAAGTVIVDHEGGTFAIDVAEIVLLFDDEKRRTLHLYMRQGNRLVLKNAPPGRGAMIAAAMVRHQRALEERQALKDDVLRRAP